MCKRTVINRACKQIINSSDDSYLFDDSDKTEREDKENEEELTTNANTGDTITFAEDAEIIPEIKQEEAKPADIKPEQANGVKTPEIAF